MDIYYGSSYLFITPTWYRILLRKHLDNSKVIDRASFHHKLGLNASKPLVISLLVVAVAYSSSSVSAAVTRGPKECTLEDGGIRLHYCQTETDDEGIEIRWWTDCRVKAGVGYSSCGPRYQASEVSIPIPGDTGVLEQPPTPPTFGPTAPLQGGVLEQPEQTPPPFAPGFLERQEQPPADQGPAELPPPAVEETQPATLEEEPAPLCPGGQVLDEESGLCVSEEQEGVVEEPSETQSDDEEQTSDQEDSNN